MTATIRLPSRFPVGTKFVIEGKPGKGGKLQVTSRYLVMPNGTHYDLMGKGSKLRRAAKNRRTSRSGARPSAERRAG